MKVSLANPSIAPHIKQNVLAYYEAGQLDCFYSSFINHPDNKLASFLAKFKKIGKELDRRSFAELPIKYFHNRPLPELIRSVAARKLNPIITDRIWEWAELGFDNWTSKQINKNKPDVIHTYEHAALKTLQTAKALGIYTIYEQLSQHHGFFTSIVEAQLKQYPLLKSNHSDLLINEKAIARNARRDEELAIADLILCNSSFTKRTLVNAGVPETKIKVIPLAFPKTLDTVAIKDKNSPIKFLYAGNQSIRKGTHLLFEAWRQCGFETDEAELWLIGSINKELLLNKELPSNVIIKENIPHQQLMELYQQIDVFVLPTLADGFGMVVTEAMSQGVPVIATENSCGPDIIDHKKNGWVIPAGDISALANAMRWAVNNRNSLSEMGMNALQKAKSWQWADYRKGLVQLVNASWPHK